MNNNKIKEDLDYFIKCCSAYKEGLDANDTYSLNNLFLTMKTLEKTFYSWFYQSFNIKDCYNENLSLNDTVIYLENGKHFKGKITSFCVKNNIACIDIKLENGSIIHDSNTKNCILLKHDENDE